MDKVWMFDVDGTLCWGIGDKTLHKTAVQWLEKNKPQRVALCTNQGGVGLRYWMEPRPDEGYEGFGHDRWPNLPTESDVENRLNSLAAQIKAITGGEVNWYASFAYQSQKGNWSPTPPDKAGLKEWSNSWRKPEPGMLFYAALDYDAELSHCVFVGDSDEDRQAADSLGIEFVDANELFSVDVTIHYPSSWVADWLDPYQRIGLDLEASTARLEGGLVNELSRYWRIGTVTAVQLPDDDDEFLLSDGDEFLLSDGAEAVVSGEALARTISDMFINREWLVYESAQEHADALRGTRWLFANDLIEVYGIDQKEAWRLAHGWNN